MNANKPGRPTKEFIRQMVQTWRKTGYSYSEIARNFASMNIKISRQLVWHYGTYQVKSYPQEHDVDNILPK